MIKYYNRNTKEYEVEKVAGDKYLSWIYSSPIGMCLLELFIKKKLFSYAYGKYCDTPFSTRKIESFIKDFDIDMSIYESSIKDFKCFNDFFIRKVTSNGRPISNDVSHFISPGDGRLLAYSNIDMNKLIQVKGFTYSLKSLINDDKIAEKYENGICLVLRLCPTDYHRFHFVDNGTCEPTKKISGSYYSVNPVALNKKAELYCQNKREWSVFHSENFGDILHIEVGATCVGTIVQSYTPNSSIKKGDEKGFFKFGGSTTILFIEKDKLIIDSDILEQAKLGCETKVSMGEKIGVRL
jgi:phosphatidylserine decarboxylase precursor